MRELRRPLAYVCVFATVALTASAATAAPPKVAGVYAVMSWTFCQTNLITTTAGFAIPGGGSAPAIKNFSVPKQGGIDVGVGVITFPETPSSSGDAAVGLVNIGGSAVRHSLNSGPYNGIPFKRKNQTPSGTFAFSEDKLTLLGDTYDMQVGNTVGGVARTIYLVRATTAPSALSSCLLAISATKK